ncbi:MAG TPA: hypothetical protein PKO30_07215 [Prolixibacteraceae bacterium]|nr:hypothetical protein [Prolixibacteraceae bacterium]
MKSAFILTLILFALSFNSYSQTREVIDDEANVPEYQLPDVLTRFNGRKVKTAKDWIKKQRPEILQKFTEEEYGKVPGAIAISDVKIWETTHDVLNGKAVRRQLSLFFKKADKSLEVNVLMYLPKSSKKIPVFLGYNFSGNHTILNDPNIRLTESWVNDNPSVGIINNHVTEQSRGCDSNSWPVEEIVKAGYGLVTVYYGDIDPDRNDLSDGIQPFLYKENQTSPRFDEWGSIAAWAWGLSRVMDYLEKDELVDASKVAIIGHSRLGKAALWAGANDERFAMVISNESGCGGAALSKRIFGETIQIINTSFPHWFCGNFKKYNGNEEELSFDQHMLLALIAPRPLYVASAEDDKWADPRGEFLSAKYASAVYKLMGKEGLPVDEMPEVNKPVMGTIGYHIRSGKHNLTLFDWQQYIKFADKFFK